MRDVFILDAVRTPRGRGKAGKGALSGVHPQELLAQALNHLAKKPASTGRRRGRRRRLRHAGRTSRARTSRATRCSRPAGRTTVTGVTLNRFCGSGSQAVNFARDGRDARPAGARRRRRRREHVARADGLATAACSTATTCSCARGSAWCRRASRADLIATLEGFTRDDVDAFALASQQKAARAIEGGRFAKSLFAVVERRRQGRCSTRTSTRAPAPRSRRSPSSSRRSRRWARRRSGPNGETLDQLALKRYPAGEGRSSTCTPPATRAASSTARPSVLLASERVRARRTASSRARGSAPMATAGAEPVIMLTAPAPASREGARSSRA